jgi:hypothetical protein
MGLSLVETGSPSSPVELASKGCAAPQGAVLHFQDFVERPLRSTPPSRQADKVRGRPTGEQNAGGADCDRRDLDGSH